jgi:hypothetical protein
MLHVLRQHGKQLAEPIEAVISVAQRAYSFKNALASGGGACSCS